MELTNIEVFHAAHGDHSISCHYKGDRYHVWVDRVTKDVRPTLYKNSLVDRGQPGHFNTRHLSTSSATNAALIHNMMLTAKREGLFEKAEAAFREKDERERAALKEAARLQKINAHGVELLDKLKLCLEHFNVTDATHDRTGRPVDCSMLRKLVAETVARVEREAANG